MVKRGKRHMTESKYEELRLGDLVSRLESGVSVRADSAEPVVGEVGVLKVTPVAQEAGAMLPKASEYYARPNSESSEVQSDPTEELSSGEAIRPNWLVSAPPLSVEQRNLLPKFLTDSLARWRSEKSLRVRLRRWPSLSPQYNSIGSEQFFRNASAIQREYQQATEFLARVSELKIEVPPLREQCKIAEILRT